MDSSYEELLLKMSQLRSEITIIEQTRIAPLQSEIAIIEQTHIKPLKEELFVLGRKAETLIKDADMPDDPEAFLKVYLKVYCDWSIHRLIRAFCKKRKTLKAISAMVLLPVWILQKIYYKPISARTNNEVIWKHFHDTPHDVLMKKLGFNNKQFSKAITRLRTLNYSNEAITCNRFKNKHGIYKNVDCWNSTRNSIDNVIDDLRKMRGTFDHVNLSNKLFSADDFDTLIEELYNHKLKTLILQHCDIAYGCTDINYLGEKVPTFHLLDLRGSKHPFR